VEENSVSPEVTVSRLVDFEHHSRLPLWRATIDVDAPPDQVLHRLRSPRTTSSWRALAQPSDDVDLVEYTVNSPALDRARYFRVIRYCVEIAHHSVYSSQSFVVSSLFFVHT